MERETSIYEEVMDAVFANISLDAQEKEIVERYKALFYIRFDYEEGHIKFSTINERVKNLIEIKSEMDRLIATETIQKLLRKKREAESEKWRNLFEYLDTQN